MLSRASIFILFVALLTLASAIAACGDGGSDDPQAIAAEATLEGVESAELDLALAIGIEGQKSGKVDITLKGPFQTESEELLPELDMTATAKGAVGGEKVDFEGGLVLLGKEAFINYQGTEYEVDSTTFNFVRSLFRQQGGGQDRSSEATACQEVVTGLQLGEFIEDPRETSDVDVGGTSTTKVSGNLNATGAVDALIELSEDPACSEQLEATGQLPSRAELDEAKGTVQESLKSARVELYVGDDDIVRRIVAQATIEPSKRSGNEGAKKVDVDFDLTLTGVNEEQTITVPQRSEPLSELFIKLGINPLELVELLEGEGGLGSGGLNGLLEGLGSGSPQ